MEERTTISIPSDSGGFISRKCQACSRLFKIHLDDSGNELAHCPYCNAEGNDWFTDEQRKYVEAAGLNFAQDVIGKQLDEMARKFNRSMPRGGLITGKMTNKPGPRRPLPPKPVEPEAELPIFTFDCCNEPVKHDGSSGRLFCIICGKTAVMS